MDVYNTMYPLPDVSYLSPVKYQGRCGSCWAFVVTGALESAMAIAGRPMQQLSEQQLVDCTGASTKYELAGCSGMAARHCQVDHSLPIDIRVITVQRDNVIIKKGFLVSVLQSFVLG